MSSMSERRGLAFRRFGHFILVLLAFACQADAVDPEIPAIQLSSDRLTLIEGDAADLNARLVNGKGHLQPQGAVRLSWSSSDMTVAVVDPAGIVSAIAPGIAKISAITVGARSASAQVQVGPRRVASVRIDPLVLFADVGIPVRLTAVVQDDRGVILANRPVSWRSSNDTVVAIDASGQATPLAIGTANITVTSDGVSGSSSVTVRRAAVDDVEVNPSAVAIEVAQRLPLSVILQDAEGRTLSNRVVAWTTADPTVATVTDGVVEAVSVGETVVTATAEGAIGGTTISVLPRAVASVQVSPSSTTIDAGTSTQLSASLRAADGTALTDRAVSWSTSDTAIATVEPGGRVNGIAPGMAAITGAASSAKATALVQVRRRPVTSLVVAPASASLSIGQTIQLHAGTHASDGTALTDRPITWSSSNAPVASVSATGLVRANAAGVATISASSEGKTASATIAVSAVPRAPVASVSVTPSSDTLELGQTVQLQAVTRAADGSIVTGRAISWSTSDAAIASVSGSGLVRALAPGNANIRAATEGREATALIYVAPTVTPQQTVNVHDFGALGDGRTDDTQAFKAALAAIPAAGGELYVPRGTYMLTPFSQSPKRALDLSGRSGIVVRGEGMDATILKTTPGHYQGSTLVLYMNLSSGITVQDLTLDGSWSEGQFPDEQSHCVDIWASSDVTIERARIRNCKGDGVRLLGVPRAGDPWTERVRIANSAFEDLGRGGVAGQRATRHIDIRDNLFTRISDQSLGFEPTGIQAGALEPTDYVIEGNRVLNTTGAHAVAFKAGKRIRFLRNELENATIFIVGSDSMMIAENIIKGDTFHQPIKVQNASYDIRIERNIIEDRWPIGSGTNAIALESDGGHAPRKVAIRGNTIRAATSGIKVSDVEEVEILDNEIIGQGAGHGIIATNVLLTGVPHHGFLINGNKVRNFTTGIRFAKKANSDGFAAVQLHDNEFRDDQPTPTQTIGIEFSQMQGYLAFAVVGNNIFGRGILIPIKND